MESAGIAGAERFDGAVNEMRLNNVSTPSVNNTRCFFAVFCFSGSMRLDA